MKSPSFLSLRLVFLLIFRFYKIILLLNLKNAERSAERIYIFFFIFH